MSKVKKFDSQDTDVQSTESSTGTPAPVASENQSSHPQTLQHEPGTIAAEQAGQVGQTGQVGAATPAMHAPSAQQLAAMKAGAANPQQHGSVTVPKDQEPTPSASSKPIGDGPMKFDTSAFPAENPPNVAAPKPDTSVKPEEVPPCPNDSWTLCRVTGSSYATAERRYEDGDVAWFPPEEVSSSHGVLVPVNQEK